MFIKIKAEVLNLGSILPKTKAKIIFSISCTELSPHIIHLKTQLSRGFIYEYEWLNLEINPYKVRCNYFFVMNPGAYRRYSAYERIQIHGLHRGNCPVEQKEQ